MRSFQVLALRGQEVQLQKHRKSIIVQARSNNQIEPVPDRKLERQLGQTMASSCESASICRSLFQIQHNWLQANHA